MVERSEKQPPQRGSENTDIEEHVEAQGGEGRRNANATPPIGDDAKHEQTAVPAPDDEVGVPPDEEMGRPDA